MTVDESLIHVLLIEDDERLAWLAVQYESCS